MKTKKITVPLDCDLTEALRVEYGHQVATLTLEISGLETEKKESASDFKERIDVRTAEARRLSGILKAGKEPRSVACEEQFDFANRSVSVWRLDTGELVTSRTMELDEMQETMPLEGGKIIRLGNDD